VQHVLGNEWTIKSAGGSTGEAYFAQSKHQRLFLKRNTSPFLAVLSAQGIVPKLIWTKRLENGDVITAQEWVDGRVMKPDLLHHPSVAELLGRIHHSPELLDMLTRMGKKPLNPELLYQELVQLILESELAQSPIVERALSLMSEHLDLVCHIKPVVCHCDLNHHNWFLTNRGDLYLIDWDNAEIGDPAIDLAMMFEDYIDENEQDRWLENYGLEPSITLNLRIHWYILYQALNKLAFARNILDRGNQLSKIEEILVKYKWS